MGRAFPAVLLLALQVPPLELHTFSIVARDPVTGDFGVGVCTFPRGVRRLCPFARAGVGAVSTQAQVNVGFGKKGLKLMEEGLTPRQAVEKCCEEDRNPDVRQLAMIDAKNPPFAFTGKRCNDHASHVVGKDYAVQGNLLAGRETVEAVARAFEETPGSLAGRILAALSAGKAAGGDRRGHHSCAVIVASRRSGEKELLLDLFEDDAEEPIESVRKKFLEGAAEWMQIGDRELKVGDRGADVRELKAALSWGRVYRGTVDDLMDGPAEEACKTFRGARGWNETCRALAGLVAERRKSEY
jgi:uncharacterized Ntn-hydrolase superfamily protein